MAEHSSSPSGSPQPQPQLQGRPDPSSVPSVAKNTIVVKSKKSQSHGRRARRDSSDDPFPKIITTETPTISTDELLANDDEPEPTGSQQIPRYAPSGPIPKSSRPLRPAQDILNRLVWDPTLRANSTTISADPDIDLLFSAEDENSQFSIDWTYVIGYLDRFSGVLEITLDEWMQRREDVDGEDWLPMHRILWVKRRVNPGPDMEEWGEGELDWESDKEGENTEAKKPTDTAKEDEKDTKTRKPVKEELLWDRHERIDRIFGSGNGAGISN